MSSFEKDIQGVFDGAEFQPSGRVWNGIETALKAKKKKGVFFMWQTYGVAAGLVLLLSLGFLANDGFFNKESTLPTKELSNKQPNQAPKDSNQKPESGQSLDDSNETTSKKAAALDGQKNSNKDSTTLGQPSIALPKADALEETQLRATLEAPKALSTEQEKYSRSNVDFESLKAKLKPYRKSLAAEKIRFNAIMAMVPMKEINQLFASTPSADQKKASKENSLNGSFGNSLLSLSSNENSNRIVAADVRNPNSFSSLNQSVESGEDQVSGAISVGFGITLDLSQRLSLNLGTRYSEFRFRNTSNAYSVEEGRSLPIYAPVGFSPENVFFIGEYDLENTIQSVFLQSTLSYKVLSFGQFDISVNAGVGVDYFLAYKVKGELNFLETRKVNPAESNFLNRTNFSGVSGFGVNYRVNPQIGLSGEVNYRRFLKNNSDDIDSSAASVVGFGLSVNYFLNRKED